MNEITSNGITSNAITLTEKLQNNFARNNFVYVLEEFGIHKYQNRQLRLKLGYNCNFSSLFAESPVFSSAKNSTPHFSKPWITDGRSKLFPRVFIVFIVISLVLIMPNKISLLLLKIDNVKVARVI